MTGKPDAVVTGSPTYNQYSVLVSPSGYLDTLVKDSDSSLQTFIVVAKKPAASGIYVGSYNGNASDSGKNLFFDSNAFKASTNGSISPTIASVDASSANSSSYLFLSLRSIQDNIKIRAYLSSGVASDAIASGGNSAISRNIRIGACYVNSSFPGPLDIAFAAIYNAALTDQEEQDAYSFLKSFYNGKITMI